MKTIKCISYLILSGFLFFVGCEEDEYLDVANPNAISENAFFQNEKHANLALNAAYSGFKEMNLYGREYANLVHLLSNEAELNYFANADWNQLANKEVTANNGTMKVVWIGFYRTIARANDVIQNVPYIPEGNISEVNADHIMGQAYFLRAICYFHLVRLWGVANHFENPDALGVPLILEVPSSRELLYPSRASVGEVYNQIISDLNLAENLLPDEPWTGKDVGRINKLAVTALLGKVYLFMEDWETAIEKFEIVLNSEEYDLAAELMFCCDGNHENNEESIFEIQYSKTSEADIYSGGTQQHFAMIHGASIAGGFSNMNVSQYDIDRFGDDPRLQQSVFLPGMDSLLTASGYRVVPSINTKKFFNKHEVENRDPGYSANIVVLRLADLYLMYAEALNKAGNDVLASEYMNKVRRRAYLSDPETPNPEIDYTGFTGTQLQDSIREERYRELFYEHHRWDDIRRWGIGEEEFAARGTNSAGNIVFDEHDYYLPMPQEDIDANINLEQSPGYR